jgi:hypothetical protein
MMWGLGTTVMGCVPSGMIQLTQNGPGGKKTLYEKKFDGWAEMFQAMDGAARASGKVAGAMVEKLTSVPPPGHVTIVDLSPGLAQFSGKSTDALATATKDDPEKFRYVQIGVRPYDDFFKASAELYGFVFQVRQTLVGLDARASAVAQGEGKLSSRVDAAFTTASADAKAELQEWKEMSAQLAGLASDFGKKIGALTTAAQELVAAAPATIVQPKLVAHVDLVVEGVKSSASMVTTAGKLLVETGGELSGFS